MSKRRRSENEELFDMARNMRKLCKGAFGTMDTDCYNHRVLGTSGTSR